VIRVECDALGGTLLIFPINEARCSRYTPRAFTQEEEIQDLRLEIKALKKQLADKKPTNKSKKK
jgi:AmiR/NasT family two-component response regulator